MAGGIVLGLILLGISIYYWHLVFNEPARHKLEGAKWWFFKMNKEQREIDDAVNQAGIIIVAVTSSVFFLALVMLGIVRLFQ